MGVWSIDSWKKRLVTKLENQVELKSLTFYSNFLKADKEREREKDREREREKERERERDRERDRATRKQQQQVEKKQQQVNFRTNSNHEWQC